MPNTPEQPTPSADVTIAPDGQRAVYGEEWVGVFTNPSAPPVAVLPSVTAAQDFIEAETYRRQRDREPPAGASFILAPVRTARMSWMGPPRVPAAPDATPVKGPEPEAFTAPAVPKRTFDDLGNEMDEHGRLIAAPVVSVP
jgi:hypothetical protein